MTRLSPASILFRSMQGNVLDAVMDSLSAPVSSSMVAIYEMRLNWRPEALPRGPRQ